LFEGYIPAISTVESLNGPRQEVSKYAVLIK
jgi:hypothetical protein